MKILVSMSLPKLLSFESPHLGRLITPRHTGSVDRALERGLIVACDNDAFGAWSEARYLAMLEHVRDRRLAFVTVKDVVGDHAATLAQWKEWAPRVRAYGVRLAFVLQDGATVDTVPWAELDAVFVGGTTRWKLGAKAREIVREAKRRGKHIHMGRVNTLSRLRYAFRIGCDTVDGSSWGYLSETKLPRALDLLDRLHAALEARRLDSFGDATA